MRIPMIGMALVFATLIGCGQGTPEPDKAGDKDQQAAVSCQLAPGLTVELPKGWKVSEKEGLTDLKAPVEHCHMQLWTVTDATAPAEVLPKVAEMVKGKVLNFKAGQTLDVMIAGAPAKHLIGTGVEADDHDVAKVEVFIFPVGKKVFLLCAHTGEDDPAKQRREILEILNTAKAG